MAIKIDFVKNPEASFSILDEGQGFDILVGKGDPVPPNFRLYSDTLKIYVDIANSRRFYLSLGASIPPMIVSREQPSFDNILSFFNHHKRMESMFGTFTYPLMALTFLLRKYGNYEVPFELIKKMNTSMNRELFTLGKVDFIEDFDELLDKYASSLF